MYVAVSSISSKVGGCQPLPGSYRRAAALKLAERGVSNTTVAAPVRSSTARQKKNERSGRGSGAAAQPAPGVYQRATVAVGPPAVFSSCQSATALPSGPTATSGLFFT